MLRLDKRSEILRVYIILIKEIIRFWIKLKKRLSGNIAISNKR